jgi:tight adherence protein C
MDNATLFSGCIFGAITMIGIWLSRFLGGDHRVHDRLSNTSQEFDSPQAASASGKEQLKSLFAKIGQAASKPFMPETRERQSDLRRRLAMAGIYTPSAIRTVTGFRMILLVGGVLGGYLLGVVFGSQLLGLSIGGLLGYLAPNLWIKMQVKKQQRALENGLPDALDLMVICVEAGLAVDAAMERVGEELTIVHPRLSRELEVTHMETRVGLSRMESLKNMGVRTGCPAVQSLASMLIQADRFGTSVAGALRVHADSLRVARQQRAEEMAAKASVKISFPLVCFIFPATFIVLAGPTIVDLMNSSLMN